MAVARQWHGKQVSMATNTPTTIEEWWEGVFSVQSMPRLYNEDQQDKLVTSHEQCVQSQKLQVVAGHE
jgi:hypothetical protein